MEIQNRGNFAIELSNGWPNEVSIICNVKKNLKVKGKVVLEEY